jgi:hypothetical protein
MTEQSPSPDIELLWEPALGAEWSRLIRRLAVPYGPLTPTSVARFESDCRRILGLCAQPQSPPSNARTGLVLGQVQSGKTMSFTGISALARDNGFQLVIVITGISVQLLDQSAGRLRSDLGVDGQTRAGWVHVPVKPEVSGESVRDALVRQLAMWADADTPPHLKKTVLITVMKNHKNLEKLAGCLQSVNACVNGGLGAVPTIVIDDEADQASLNTKVHTGELSAVYRHISQLRCVLPNHSMLQYTATPQAPLLLNIADILSPDFCHVLDPGAEYTGGRSFFLENGLLIKEIPPADLGSNAAPPPSVPSSLHEAIRLFVLGVAVEIQSPEYETRSMLIHPSSQTELHSVFVLWVRSALELWRRLLSRPGADPDRLELLEDFRRSHGELARTVANLPSFEVISPQLKLALLQIRLEEVNSTRGITPLILWELSPAWILVGGQALDRGFTVRGLTVSYMPRPLATGQSNADTLQQRARFFGYRRSYLGFCRVWMEISVKQAFVDYVQHEDDLRSSLKRFERLNRPLSEWRRRFILDAAMAPTRRNVIDIGWTHSVTGAGAVSLRFPHYDRQACLENQKLVEKVRSTVPWREHGDASLSVYQRHLVSEDYSLRGICESFLTVFRTSSLEDADALNARLLQYSTILSNQPDARCDLFLMSYSATERRRRTVNQQTGGLDQFLQGSNPGADGRASYAGDRGICRSDRVTVQIHVLDIQFPDQSVIRNVPTLALFAPNAPDIGVVVQPQGWVGS